LGTSPRKVKIKKVMLIYWSELVLNWQTSILANNNCNSLAVLNTIIFCFLHWYNVGGLEVIESSASIIPSCFFNLYGDCHVTNYGKSMIKDIGELGN
jgi:hypothetical protein